MRDVILFLINFVLLVMTIGCQNDDKLQLSTIECDAGIDTFTVPLQVPIAYDKARAIVRDPRDELAMFTLESNKQYKLLGARIDSVVARNTERGKFFTLYKDGHLFTFKSPSVREYVGDSLIREYIVSDSFTFFGSLSARPIITDEYIIAMVYPNSDLTSGIEEYIRLLHHRPLFVVINRLSGESQAVGSFPTDVFPYNQDVERKFNGLEHSCIFCFIGDEVYFLFRTSGILNKVNVETGEQQKVFEFDHHAFDDVGKDPADELWEQNQKGTYIAANSFVNGMAAINNGAELVVMITEKQKMDGNYLDQLENNSTLVVFDLKIREVTDSYYIENHYPYLIYADEAVIILRERRKISDEQEDNHTRFTVIPHDCLSIEE